MNCEEASKLIEVYADGELDPISSRHVDEHLRSCAGCEQAFKTQRILARTIEHAAPYYRASSDLRDRIRASLRNAIEETPELRGESAQFSGHGRATPLSWNWLAIAATILVAAVVGFTLSSRSQRPDGDQFLATQLIASHVRSLMANHLTDVASSDQHTVKPWLDEKLDFAAPVVDLANDGFPLLGGRLDYMDNHAVAALVYQRRKHYINLFVWPAEGGNHKTSKISRQGYHLLHWSDADFNYWAVSDVNADDLQAFQELFAKQRR